MVTLQILVLSFMVRVRVPQQETKLLAEAVWFFWFNHLAMMSMKHNHGFSFVLLPLMALALLAGVLPVGAMPPVRLQKTSAWHAGAVVSAQEVASMGLDQCFRSDPIPDNVFARMRGKSYPMGCRVSRASLRYVRLLHCDEDGKTRMGELVCNKQIAADVLRVFRQLYDEGYPIHSVRLIDDFGADDERSMRANNTSCFCYREVKGSRKLSAHALGMAVDLNPLYNPYYRKHRNGKVTVQPANALKYCDRNARFPYKITRSDRAYRLFVSLGFQWGGAWRSVKDYQHFEK